MYKFKIKSLKCMSCFHNIEEVLKEADSSVNAEADIRNQILTVESDLPMNELSKLN
jgi:copper chaperone CopZ